MTTAFQLKIFIFFLPMIIIIEMIVRTIRLLQKWNCHKLLSLEIIGTRMSFGPIITKARMINNPPCISGGNF